MIKKYESEEKCQKYCDKQMSLFDNTNTKITMQDLINLDYKCLHIKSFMQELLFWNKIFNSNKQIAIDTLDKKI